jgi:uncharacterized membrane protein
LVGHHCTYESGPTTGSGYGAKTASLKAHVTDPSATAGTIAAGINATGQIVGAYGDASGNHGFLLSGALYTTLNDPSATNGTAATGINVAGQIVGTYQNASGNHGFSSTRATVLTPPSTIPWAPTAPLHRASTTRVRS